MHIDREGFVLIIALIGLGIGVVFTNGRTHTALFLFWLVLLVISFAWFVGMFGE